LTSQNINISASSLVKTLLIIGGIFALLYYGKALIVPLVVGAVVAIILDIPVKKFNNLGSPSWLSITLSVLIMLIIFTLLFWLISSQVGNIAEDWPTIKEKSIKKLNSLSQWSKEKLNWNYKNYVEGNENLINKIESLTKAFATSFMNFLSKLLIIFIYIILFLAQKNQFIKFFRKLFSNKKAINTVLVKSAATIRNYFVGKGKIMVFLFVIYYGGFLIGSVPYALFLAIFAALFSIIPYVGNLIGGGVAVILSYLYEGSTPAFIVIGVLAAAQLIENYLLTPWIIGDEIDLSPFITIFGIIFFSSLWGLIGAVIALPLIGVLKVIFEHTTKMEPYAYLLRKKS